MSTKAAVKLITNTPGLTKAGFRYNHSLEPLIGIGVAHASHLGSALVLYQLGLRLYRDPKLSFVSALLHILSPAGLFLSAPYNESPFSFLSFLGYFLFAGGNLRKSSTFFSGVSILCSGVVFGLATTFRSNGLLNGIPFATYAIAELPRNVKAPTFTSFCRVITLGLGGLCVAIGSIGPQVVAYQIFCSEASATEARDWCTKRLPSIYTFVQERYWSGYPPSDGF